nr:hypothetical protein YSBCXYJI_YSBCXYJI_CDS_0089 [Caudoviricetes sp.]
MFFLSHFLITSYHIQLLDPKKKRTEKSNFFFNFSVSFYIYLFFIIFC